MSSRSSRRPIICKDKESLSSAGQIHTSFSRTVPQTKTMQNKNTFHGFSELFSYGKVPKVVFLLFNFFLQFVCGVSLLGVCYPLYLIYSAELAPSLLTPARDARHSADLMKRPADHSLDGEKVEYYTESQTPVCRLGNFCNITKAGVRFYGTLRSCRLIHIWPDT